MGAGCSGAVETTERPELTFPHRSRSQMRPIDDVLLYVAARDPKKIAALTRSLLLEWRFIPELISLIDSFFVTVEHTWHPIALPPSITLKTVALDEDGTTLYSKGVISGLYQFTTRHSILTGPRRWRVQIEFPKGPTIVCKYCEKEGDTCHDVVCLRHKEIGWVGIGATLWTPEQVSSQNHVFQTYDADRQNDVVIRTVQDPKIEKRFPMQLFGRVPFVSAHPKTYPIAPKKTKSMVVIEIDPSNRFICIDSEGDEGEGGAARRTVLPLGIPERPLDLHWSPCVVVSGTAKVSILPLEE
jgi:hypothetical protein